MKDLGKHRRTGVHTVEMSTVEARSHFADVVNRVYYREEHVILKRRGQEVGIIIPIAHMQQLLGPEVE